MSIPHVELTCPHCGFTLKAFSIPDGIDWDDEHHWACFNNDCSYYRDGWTWMREQYNIKASYRFRVTSPTDKKGSPIAVPTEDALLDLIIEK